MSTLEAVAALVLLRLGDCLIVDLVETDGSTHRLTVVHLEPGNRRLARTVGAF